MTEDNSYVISQIEPTPKKRIQECKYAIGSLCLATKIRGEFGNPLILWYPKIMYTENVSQIYLNLTLKATHIFLNRGIKLKCLVKGICIVVQINPVSRAFLCLSLELITVKFQQ